VYRQHRTAHGQEVVGSGLPDEGVGSLFQDSRGRLWVSTLTGIGYLENDRFIPAAAPGGLAESLTEDTSGNLWIANRDLGLLRLSQDHEFPRIPWATFGRKDPAVVLAADPWHGGLWLGFSQGGIAWFRDGHVQSSYSAADGLGEGRVNQLRFDGQGTLWIASEGGLGRLKNGRITTLTTKSGLPCDAVQWTIEDNAQSVWIMMPCGLVRVARSELDTWASAADKTPGTIRTTVFDNSDGLRTLAVVGDYTPRVAKSADGKLWFSVPDGISVIDPHQIPFNKLPPPVHIEKAIADRKEYLENLSGGAPSNPRLPPRVRELEIDYTALSLVAPEKVLFRYKLEGWDQEWQDAGTRRQAFYSNLPPRNYTFRVQACNNSGLWNEAGTSLDFSIAPAYYQTYWFRLSCFAAVGALLWALYRWRIRQLKGQEKRLRDVVETIPAMTFTALSDGSCTFVNKRWTEYTGLSVEQSSGSDWKSAVHAEDLARYSENWRISVATGQPFEDEARFRRAADGEYRWFLVRGVPLRDQHGKIVRWYGTLADIEDRKRAGEALQRSELYLREGQRLAHTGSWALNSAGFYYWSSELFHVYGLDPGGNPPTIKEYLDLVHPEDRNFMEQEIQKMLTNHREFDFTKRIVRPDGNIRYVRCVGVPVTEGVTFQGFVGTGMDVTEQKLLEEERERIRQLETELAHTNRVSILGEMAASLAHEIKQPIAAAITSANSCIEWLAHEPPNLDRARAAAARIDKYGNRAAEIIDRIRSLYKKSPPQRELVDVNGIIQEMLTLLKGEADRYSVAMRAELAAELPKIIADPVQLQQVFMNLMLNAIEAMKDSGGELTVKSELQDGQLQFSVSDTGVGLPMEKMDQIFSAFFTTKPQGSGMGLAISRSIVESHGGQLWASANSGRGAIFHFTLPIQVTGSSPLVA
jgi:PAS domain S-box-containing protein